MSLSTQDILCFYDSRVISIEGNLISSHKRKYVSVSVEEVSLVLVKGKNASTAMLIVAAIPFLIMGN